jgi:hypothetical protein
MELCHAYIFSPSKKPDFQNGCFALLKEIYHPQVITSECHKLPVQIKQ